MDADSDLSVTVEGSALVIDIQRTTLTAMLLSRLLVAVRNNGSAKCVVISSACTGMDLSTLAFGTPAMDDALRQFGALHEALVACPVPIIHVATGAVRGGGMLFPGIADVCLATREATFGFPEIRRGALPSIVSVSCARRLTQVEARRYMLSGDSFDTQQALKNGFVDFVGDTLADVEREVQRLRQRFTSIDGALLQLAKRECPAPSVERAMVTVGNLHKPPASVAADKLVQLRVFEGGVAILEIDDAERANAMDEPLAAQFGAAVDEVRARSDVRVLIVQGNGDHFCTGIHPYSFVRAMQNTTVLDAAARVFQLYASFCKISSLEVPVLCVLHGKVVGGGFALALNADWRVAAAGTTFNYGNLPRGVCPGLQLSRNLPAAVGGARAMSLYLDDPTLSAAQLSDLGLLNAVAATVAEARQLALAKAVALASAAPSGVRQTLVSMRRAVVDLDLLAREAVGMAQCLVEGGAFANKAVTGGPNKQPSAQLQVAPAAVQEPPLSSASVQPPAAAAAAKPKPSLRPGVHAMEVYVPRLTVLQSALEVGALA